MRRHIISEIQRIAAINGGKAPGNQAFASATGINESKWRGKYWARWGDALIEAGFEPNEWTARSDVDALLDGIITACRHYGHFPTNAELALLRSNDSSIPSPRVVQSNFGGKAELSAALRNRIANRPDLQDIEALLPVAAINAPIPQTKGKAADGSVYLLKSGHYYKIGRSDDLERRVKEIRTSLPDAASLVHSITTDDPSGIEAYWHRRFAERRANGEWFKLTPTDVKAFTRRKFQ